MRALLFQIQPQVRIRPGASAGCPYQLAPDKPRRRIGMGGLGWTETASPLREATALRATALHRTVAGARRRAARPDPDSAQRDAAVTQEDECGLRREHPEPERRDMLEQPRPLDRQSVLLIGDLGEAALDRPDEALGADARFHDCFLPGMMADFVW